MSDRYHLHCETHDVEGVGLQRGNDALSYIWANRAIYVALYELYFDVIDVPYQAEVQWANAFQSDHEFDASLIDVAAWMKAHDDCAVYVYCYDRRVDECFGYVDCSYCGSTQRCKRKINHGGDHSTERDA